MKTTELQASTAGSENSCALSNLSSPGIEEISTALRGLLADVFALYVKTKNFHWHMSGRHFRDFHLMLDDQSDQLFAMIDPVAERTRKLGGRSLHSIGDISRNQRLQDNDEPHLAAEAMLKQLLLDNQELTGYLRSTHEICDRHNDVATASLLENWIDETEQRVWFLYEIVE
jgi:starvation-inducible DNA-binding protein